MSELVRYEGGGVEASGGLRAVDPAARGLAVAVRPATQDDFANIDALQKAESDGLGFQFEQAIRRRIEQGNVLVAEAARGSGNRGQGSGKASDVEPDPRSPIPDPSPVFAGYCLGVDRYQKRSELGIIYQLGVVAEFRRSLVAATLLQAQFDKSAYGTKLYCCWCKQSLAANRFWEAMGFVPLAFRAAGRSTIEKLKKKRGNTSGVSGGVHIFWQKRIRVGDTRTPWWYPYETTGGAMMEGRIVLPLPPEMGWQDAAPVVLPGAERREQEQRLLEAKVSEAAKRERAAKKANAKTPRRQDAKKNEQRGVVAPRVVGAGGFGVDCGFGQPAASPEVSVPADRAMLTKDEAELARVEAEKAAAKRALREAQRRNDPELVAYARELRDRWQEHVGPGGKLAGMIEAKAAGRYEVGRLLAGPERNRVTTSGPAQATAEAKRLAA